MMLHYNFAIFFLILVLVFANHADFLEKQRKLAEALINEIEDGELEGDVDAYETEVSSDGYMSDPYYAPQEQMEYDEVSEVIDVNENPYKTIKGFYIPKKPKFQIVEPCGVGYISEDFTKEVMLKHSCYQQGYVVEDGHAYTDEELAELNEISATASEGDNSTITNTTTIDSALNSTSNLAL